MAAVSIETGLAVAAVAGGVVGAVCILGALLLEPATGRSNANQAVANLLNVFFGFCYFQLSDWQQYQNYWEDFIIISFYLVMFCYWLEKRKRIQHLLAQFLCSFFFSSGQFPLKILTYSCSSVLQRLT